MSGFLDAYSDRAVPARIDQPLISPPSSLSTRLGASIDELMAPDHWYMQGQAKFQDWEGARIALRDRTGEDLPNPYESAPGYKELYKYNGSHEAMAAARSTAIINSLRVAREQYPDLPDPELIERSIAQRSRYARDQAHSLEDTGHGIGNFLGTGLASVAIDPIQTGLMLFPGTAIGIPAEMALKGFLANAGKEAAYQGVSQMLGSAASQSLDYWARKPLGTEQSFEEIAGNILGAGAGGVLLGGGIRGLHLAWNKFRTEAVLGKLDNIPPEVRGAAYSVEAKELYEANNPLGVNPAAHDAALNKAVTDITQGKPVSVAPVLEQETTPLARAEEATVAKKRSVEGYDRYPDDALKGRIEWLQEKVVDPSTDPQDVKEFGRRAKTFTRFVENREELIKDLPSEQQAALRRLIVDDTVSFEDKGKVVSGVINGWDRKGIVEIGLPSGATRDVSIERINPPPRTEEAVAAPSGLGRRNFIQGAVAAANDARNVIKAKQAISDINKLMEGGGDYAEASFEVLSSKYGDKRGQAYTDAITWATEPNAIAAFIADPTPDNFSKLKPNLGHEDIDLMVEVIGDLAKIFKWKGADVRNIAASIAKDNKSLVETAVVDTRKIIGRVGGKPIYEGDSIPGHTTPSPARPESPEEGGISPGRTSIPGDPTTVPPSSLSKEPRAPGEGIDGPATAPGRESVAPEAPRNAMDAMAAESRRVMAEAANLPDNQILTLTLAENPERGRALGEAQAARDKLQSDIDTAKQQLQTLQRKETNSPLSTTEKPQSIRDTASEAQLDKLDELQMTIDGGSAVEIKNAKAEMGRLKTVLLAELRKQNNLPTGIAESNRLVDLQNTIDTMEKDLRLVEARVKHEEAGLVKEIEAMRERLRSGVEPPEAQIFAAADRASGEATRPPEGISTAEVSPAAREVPDEFEAADVKQADAVLADRTGTETNLGVSRKELVERLAEIDQLLAAAKPTKKGNLTKKSLALQQEQASLLAMRQEMDAAAVTTCAAGALV